MTQKMTLPPKFSPFFHRIFISVCRLPLAVALDSVGLLLSALFVGLFQRHANKQQ